MPRKSSESVMAEFSEHEQRFRQDFQMAAENMFLSGIGGETANKSHAIRANRGGRRSRNTGFCNLENLLQLMDQLLLLQHDNMALKRKCSFLEDTKEIVSLQYKAQQAANIKMMHKSSTFLTKAGNKVMHYLSSPSTSVTSPQFQPTSPQLAPHTPTSIAAPMSHGALQLQHPTYHRVNSDVSAYTTDVIEDKPRPILIQRRWLFSFPL